MFMVISDYLIGKRVASTPYLPKSMSRLLPQYCHLRLYNDTPGLEDLIETEEEKLNFRKMAPTKEMFVLWEKGELKIRCEIDGGHVTENEKTVSLDDIYRLDRNVVSFLVKATGDADVYFKFNFHPHCDEGHAFNAKFYDGDLPPNLLPAAPAKLDDILLYDIAEEIETDEHLDRLMQTLEVSQGSQSRCHELNRLPYG
ncbi:uncharacterized protein LOC105437581 [Strongylocentrotus purpuratus]|uniref:Uncharacterized protein n=1 Tax=Strongylocentrotus purpuratus TaxID=7668 RepID=A0A7M7LVL6_STRPU|nr:uncharacterized protein LOC105437581 [Strongylocentrotus purpuratus]|eukprot:XP_011662655.1 PREDICTED: uncharacterized protein LOC105437581 [Strongylocentrotus purpuratus]